MIRRFELLKFRIWRIQSAPHLFLKLYFLLIKIKVTIIFDYESAEKELLNLCQKKLNRSSKGNVKESQIYMF